MLDLENTADKFAFVILDGLAHISTRGQELRTRMGSNRIDRAGSIPHLRPLPSLQVLRAPGCMHVVPHNTLYGPVPMEDSPMNAFAEIGGKQLGRVGSERTREKRQDLTVGGT